jgi:anti-sigma factor RsiW
MPMDLNQIHSSGEEAEEWAEEYVFGRLSPEDVRSYEEHLFMCEICRRAVEKAEAFIKDFRQAAGEDPVN